MENIKNNETTITTNKPIITHDKDYYKDLYNKSLLEDEDTYNNCSYEETYGSIENVNTIDESEVEKLIDDRYDTDLVGKKIYLRSPMTCACKSSTNHICARCYGNLYYTNLDINVGKMAAEILSSQLTQKLLSAKPLLEVSAQVPYL